MAKWASTDNQGLLAPQFHLLTEKEKRAQMAHTGGEQPSQTDKKKKSSPPSALQQKQSNDLRALKHA